MCVCPLIDHGQQPMKMHKQVTLSYNKLYTFLKNSIAVYEIPFYFVWYHNHLEIISLYNEEMWNMIVSITKK